jgi:hypothetical protein
MLKRSRAYDLGENSLSSSWIVSKEILMPSAGLASAEFCRSQTNLASVASSILSTSPSAECSTHAARLFLPVTALFRTRTKALRAWTTPSEAYP